MGTQFLTTVLQNLARFYNNQQQRMISELAHALFHITTVYISHGSVWKGHKEKGIIGGAVKKWQLF